jgi:hypothetical protein
MSTLEHEPAPPRHRRKAVHMLALWFHNEIETHERPVDPEMKEKAIRDLGSNAEFVTSLIADFIHAQLPRVAQEEWHARRQTIKTLAEGARILTDEQLTQSYARAFARVFEGTTGMLIWNMKATQLLLAAEAREKQADGHLRWAGLFRDLAFTIGDQTVGEWTEDGHNGDLQVLAAKNGLAPATIVRELNGRSG